MKVAIISLLFVFVFSSISCVAEETGGRQFKDAPDFALKDLGQNTFILSSYKGKQPVLLFFWTTWCPSCRSELKVLNDIYPKLIEEGWELFAIDVAEPGYRVEKFVRNYGLGFKVLLDRDAGVMDAYGLFGVPTYVLVDKEGHIVFEEHYFSKEEYKKLIPE